MNLTSVAIQTTQGLISQIRESFLITRRTLIYSI